MVLEVIILLTTINFVFSLACIAAEDNGWFLGYNKGLLPSTTTTHQMVDVMIGWDRFTVALSGAPATTR